MKMKLLEFLPLPFVQLLRKFHRHITTNERESDNMLGHTLENSQTLISQSWRKSCKFEYFANIFCIVVLFNVFCRNHHVLMEISPHI